MPVLYDGQTDQYSTRSTYLEKDLQRRQQPWKIWILNCCENPATIAPTALKAGETRLIIREPHKKKKREAQPTENK